MPTPSISSALTAELHVARVTHPPKVEAFHLREMINVDPKGFRRDVDEYRLLEQDCLYMRRGMDHPKFGYLESFLLASAGLRVSTYHFRPGVEVEHIRYVDIVSIDRNDPDCWQVIDLYLDILEAPALEGLQATSTIVRVEDVDELVAAHTQGLISDELTQSAIETALRTRADIAACGDSIDAWLDSLALGATWAEHVVLKPVAPKE